MRAILFFGLFVSLGSCAMLGSRSTVHQVPVYPITHVAVIVAQATWPLGNDDEEEYLLFTKTLAEELSKRKIFRYTILDKKISNYLFDDLERSLMSLELSEKYDAYLLCVPVIKGRNYKVELKLIQTNPSALLIHTQHKTSFGNSYWYYQPTGGMLMDATRGAIGAFAIKLEKLEKKNKGK